MAAAFPGLAIDGTVMVLCASFAPLTVSPFDLSMSQRRRMSTPAGSRKDLQDTLAFVAAHRVRARVRCASLQDLAGALGEMDKGHMLGQSVVVMQ